MERNSAPKRPRSATRSGSAGAINDSDSARARADVSRNMREQRLVYVWERRPGDGECREPPWILGGLSHDCLRELVLWIAVDDVDRRGGRGGADDRMVVRSETQQRRVGRRPRSGEVRRPL